MAKLLGICQDLSRNGELLSHRVVFTFSGQPRFGETYLSQLILTPNLLAFLFHTVLEISDGRTVLEISDGRYGLIRSDPPTRMRTPDEIAANRSKCGKSDVLMSLTSWISDAAGSEAASLIWGGTTMVSRKGAKAQREYLIILMLYLFVLSVSSDLLGRSSKS